MSIVTSACSAIHFDQVRWRRPRRDLSRVMRRIQDAGFPDFEVPSLITTAHTGIAVLQFRRLFKTAIATSQSCGCARRPSRARPARTRAACRRRRCRSCRGIARDAVRTASSTRDAVMITGGFGFIGSISPGSSSTSAPTSSIVDSLLPDYGGISSTSWTSRIASGSISPTCACRGTNWRLARGQT